MKLGGCYLGAFHYQDAMFKAHRKGDVAGIFLRTFNNAAQGYRLLESMLKSELFSEIVVHLMPFDYSHRYPIAPSMRTLRQDASRLQALAVKFPKTKLMPSPYCEHNHKASAMKPVLDELSKAAPNCEWVNAIWKGEPVAGYTTELHVPNSKSIPRIPRGKVLISFDGFGGDGSGNITDTNVQKILQGFKKAGVWHVRWWNFRCNGKYGWKDKATLANRKHWPDVKYIKGHIAMFKLEREGQPLRRNDRLYKTFADDHGSIGVTKDNRALVILPLPLSVKTVNVLDSKGNVIDVMRAPARNPMHSGEPKGMRYYSTNYAYELGDMAFANTKSRLIRFVAGKLRTALVDADLRGNRFR